MRSAAHIVTSLAAALVASLAAYGKTCYEKHVKAQQAQNTGLRQVYTGIVSRVEILRHLQDFYNNIYTLAVTTPAICKEVTQITVDVTRNVTNIAVNVTKDAVIAFDDMVHEAGGAMYDKIGSSVTWIANLPWTMAAGVTDFFNATVQSIATKLMENVHYIAAAAVTVAV